MNTPQRGTLSQTNTWTFFMQSETVAQRGTSSQTNKWAPFMFSATV